MSGWRVEFLEGTDALAGIRAEWRALEERGLEANAYLSPRFVLPALAHLRSPGTLRAAAVWEATPGSRHLRALALVRDSGPRMKFPRRHLVTYCCDHSFLGGWLVDRDGAEEATRVLLQGLGRRGHGVHLHRMRIDGAGAEVLRRVAESSDASWHEDYTVSRAVLRLDEGAGSRWRGHVSSSRMKTLERQQRKLGETGALEWRLTSGREVSDESVESFLRLEHAGWKGEQGSSMLSRPGEAGFFREMMRTFRADGDAFFTELLLDGEIIASSANLRSQRDGFAFKVAYDSTHSRFGPGVLNELGFLKSLEQDSGGLRHLDSGADPGSFIDELWPDRERLFTGYLAFGAVSRVAAQAMAAMRMARRGVLRLARRSPRPA